MRIRTIKPEFFKHDELAELPPLIRLLFVGLWCIADCRGRLEDRPTRIKVEVLPYDKINIVEALDLLVEKCCIARYTVKGENIIQVINFRKHQRITGKEAQTVSKFPSQFPELIEDTPEAEKDEPGELPGNNGETPETTGREGKGREGNKEGKGKDNTKPPRRSRSGVVSPGALIPSQQPEPVFRRMLAINALKRRGDGTAWSAKEFAAFQAMGLHQIPDEDFTAQIEPLAYYYGSSASSLREMWRTTDDGADFRRRDLLTLLHNFSGEVDRAREWAEFQRKKIELRDRDRLGGRP